jgi:6-phosphogluconate dehydrogenase (decarboxylating)
MQLGVVGLGRMRANIVRRLMLDGHSCDVSDVNPDTVIALCSIMPIVLPIAELVQNDVVIKFL